MTESGGKAALDHGMLLSYHSQETLHRFPRRKKRVLPMRHSGASRQVFKSWYPERSAFSFLPLQKLVVRSLLTIWCKWPQLPPEHKPTALGIPARMPIPYQLECSRAMLQSLHLLFALLATGDMLTFCPPGSFLLQGTMHGSSH